MLESITPLGERGRGSRWGLTVAFFGLGSLAAGTLLGAALGGAGRLIALQSLPATDRLVVVAALIGVGCLADLGWLGLRIPTIHRQVNEQWLFLYRGWYYGWGFGFQLGLGIVTIVTTSAVYLCLAAAFLAASPVGGAAIGAAFGLARAATVFGAARVDSPARLSGVGRALERWERSSRVATEAALVGVALLAGALAVA